MSEKNISQEFGLKNIESFLNVYKKHEIISLKK